MHSVTKRAWDIVAEPGFSAPLTSNNTNSPILSVASLGFRTIGRLFPEKSAHIAYKLLFTPRKRNFQHLIGQPFPELACQSRTFITQEGTKLQAREWGLNGDYILLVSDFDDHATRMYAFIPPLVKAGFRVITFDAPGHGCSDGKEVCIPRYGRAIADIIHQLVNVHSIIAHGVGGTSAAFSLRHLNRQVNIENLVLISTPNDVENLIGNYAKPLRLPNSIKLAFHNLLESIGGENVKQFNTTAKTYDSKVRQVLVVHDKQNPFHSYKEAKDIFFSWPNASLLTTENLGHFGPTQHPEVIDKVTAFINQEEIL